MSPGPGGRGLCIKLDDERNALFVFAPLIPKKCGGRSAFGRGGGPGIALSFSAWVRSRKAQMRQKVTIYICSIDC
jgi:hypothetical protein